jgi:hypothetical protein
LLLTALRSWQSKSNKGLILFAMSLMALPVMHPLGSVVPGAWLAWAALIHLRSGGWLPTLRVLWLPITLLFLGVLGLLAWFCLQEQAWQQFQCNLRAQRLLGEGLKTNHLTIFRWLFGGLSATPMVLLLLGGLAMGCAHLIESWRSASTKPQCVDEPSSITLAAVGLLAGFAFNWLLKNPNANHLTAIMPLAVILVILLLKKSHDRWGRTIPFMAYFCLLMLSSGLLFKYAWAMKNHGGMSYRAAVHQALTSLPQTRKVWIPVAFWEAAVLESRHAQTKYQFSTFPNVLASANRREYEQIALADMQPGDLLLWDPLQEQGGVFNFVTETALRHLLIGPTQQPEQWEKLRDIKIPVQYSRGQATDFVLYRKK